ncbi:helix-turn-helix transcriptional regulator [Domibacillus indicus]|uniref:helix-turn-helix transcriptional regulator n=1 Tax=Domibacillus indicus TaxID=1437523 RepID=UPI00203FDC54|nr:response regulator transcription factor [Domibacillus indicus]MCM3789299.1 helix-turn-helix transcriptional regulator [Domibacillus indicus]
MKVYVLAKDELEAQGIEWMIKSHLQTLDLTLLHSVSELDAAFERERPLMAIVDMDQWQHEDVGKLLKRYNARWLGLSSERIFQTAYKALRFRAEDVLFRPFAPMEVIRHLQQARFEKRNQPVSHSSKQSFIQYADLFISSQRLSGDPYRMAAFLTPDETVLSDLYKELLTYPFAEEVYVFVLTDMVLAIQESVNRADLEDYQAFLRFYKKRLSQPIAIVIQEGKSGATFKSTYQILRRQAERVFFEGYDVILQGGEEDGVQEMDPFLTPLEQREWVEMLETRNMKEIQQWLEQHYLKMEPPYPDPEMVRIALTSVLAQVRRYMKSHDIEGNDLEYEYHNVFNQIIRQPVMYKIVQALQVFIRNLLASGGQLASQDTPQSLVDKTRSLIEGNYWNSQWNLADCAEALRLNKSTLSRRFAAESGRTFRDTLHRVRLDEAKRLLKETDLPFQEIARLTGYTHQTQFNAKFKQYEHRTPRDYRSGF